MNKKKIGLLILVVLLISGYFGYNYLYKDHRDIKTEEAAVKVSAQELAKMFSDNGGTSDILNSTVQVSGEVTEMDEQSITIDDSVQCSFDGGVSGVSLGDQITVKGRCIGYDDLFEIVKLDQSTIIK